MQQSPVVVNVEEKTVCVLPGVNAQEVYDFVQEWVCAHIGEPEVFGQRDNPLKGSIMVYNKPPWSIHIGNALSPLPPFSVVMLKLKDEPVEWS